MYCVYDRLVQTLVSHPIVNYPNAHDIADVPIKCESNHFGQTLNASASIGEKSPDHLQIKSINSKSFHHTGHFYL
jgi:hypothetical protein